MRRAGILYKGIPAGILIEDENGYTFRYYETYIDSGNPSVSLSLPVAGAEYKSSILHPFFDGLIPEGWLLEIAERTWKINPRDRMGLLLTCCSDCIGAVSVHPVPENDNE